MGFRVLDSMKELKTDSTAQQAEAAGISSTVWNSIPGETKDKLVSKLSQGAAKYAKFLHR